MKSLAKAARPVVAAVGLTLLIVLAAPRANAAAPKITSMSVHGLQTGATTRVVVQGTDLLPEPRLLLDLPIAAQQVQGTPKANLVEFDVTLDKSVTPGVYNLRLATPQGLTGPEVIAVNHLPQRPVVAKQVQQLPVAIHGAAAGATVQDTQFAGHKGERITIDVLARRLGSKLRPVVHLFDSQNKQLAWSLPLAALAGDARLSVELPRDDTYTVAVHDLSYASAAPSGYCLAIGQFDYVDQVFPPVLSSELSTPVELIGRFGAASASQIESAALAALVQANGETFVGQSVPGSWPASAMPVGLRPRLAFSALKELIEGRTLDAARVLPAPPVAVSGCLSAAGEEDAYYMDVAEGERISCEVFADRLTSPIDAALEVRDPKGVRLAQADDTVGPDPRLEYTVAKGVSRLEIVVSDAYRRGGADCVYRLVVSRPDNAPLPPDFKLGVFDDTLNIAENGSKVVRIEAERFNYEGPIRISVDGLPPGFGAEPAEIPAGATGALLQVRRVSDAGASQASATGSAARFVIRGQSVDLNPPIVRMAGFATHPLAILQPWLQQDIAVAATAQTQPLQVAWKDESNAPQLLLGLDTKLPVRFVRQPGAVGPLRLSLITSQPPVLVNGQPQPLQMLRSTSATVDIPLDATALARLTAFNQTAAALAALEQKKPASGDADPKLLEQIEAAAKKRDEAATQLREVETKLPDSFEFGISIPADLRLGTYDLAIRAELRSADSQTVVAEAVSPPRRFHGVVPFELVAATQDEKPVMLDRKTGTTIALTGTLNRLVGFSGPVTLTLAGLPAGVTAPRQVLTKPEETAYRLEFKLPPTFAGERLESVVLAATAAPETRRPTILAKLDLSVPVIKFASPETATATAPASPAP